MRAMSNGSPAHGQRESRSEAPPQTDEACEPLSVIRGKNPAVKHEELTGDIIGAALAVLNELKPGLEVALLLNFREAKLDWKRVVAGPAHQ